MPDSPSDSPPQGLNWTPADEETSKDSAEDTAPQRERGTVSGLRGLFGQDKGIEAPSTDGTAASASPVEGLQGSDVQNADTLDEEETDTAQQLADNYAEPPAAAFGAAKAPERSASQVAGGQGRELALGLFSAGDSRPPGELAAQAEEQPIPAQRAAVKKVTAGQEMGAGAVRDAQPPPAPQPQKKAASRFRRLAPRRAAAAAADRTGIDAESRATPTRATADPSRPSHKRTMLGIGAQRPPGPHGKPDTPGAQMEQPEPPEHRGAVQEPAQPRPGLPVLEPKQTQKDPAQKTAAPASVRADEFRPLVEQKPSPPSMAEKAKPMPAAPAPPSMAEKAKPMPAAPASMDGLPPEDGLPAAAARPHVGKPSAPAVGMPSPAVPKPIVADSGVPAPPVPSAAVPPSVQLSSVARGSIRSTDKRRVFAVSFFGFSVLLAMGALLFSLDLVPFPFGVHTERGAGPAAGLDDRQAEATAAQPMPGTGRSRQGLPAAPGAPGAARPAVTGAGAKPASAPQTSAPPAPGLATASKPPEPSAPLQPAVPRSQQGGSAREAAVAPSAQPRAAAEPDAPPLRRVEPTPSAAEPQGTAAAQPGAAAAQPGTAAAQPGTGALQPGTASPQPGTASPQPGTASPQPGTASPQPGTASPQPGAASPQPAPQPGTAALEVASNRALVAAGNQLLRRGRVEEAEARFRLVLQRDPDEHHAKEGLVRILLKRGDAEQAWTMAGQIVKKRPRRAAYRVLYGDALNMMGHHAAAREQWREALRLSPDDREAKRRLSGP